MSVLGGFCPFPLRLHPDAETGWSSNQHARVCADLSAAALSSELAVFYVDHSTNEITYYVSNYGVGLSYIPTVGYVGGTETYTFTWNNNYSDKYDTSNLVIIKSAEAAVAGGNRIRPLITIPTPRQVSVQLEHIEAGGVAMDGFTVTVL